jgi:predicted AAA+ superfamily ATPase
MPEGYLRRVVDQELQHALTVSGAVAIEGPKAVGKTSTASLVAATIVHLDDRLDPGLGADPLDVDPGLVLTGKTPVLLDEWQEVPELWNRVRHEVDHRRGKRGQFILTGSSTPDDSVRRHSGAGRFSIIQMRPMSLYESGHSSGEVSLAAMFTGQTPTAYDPAWNATQARQQIAQRIVAGGWPDNVLRPVPEAAQQNVNSLNLMREHDVRKVAGTRRDPETAGRVLRSFARNIATPASETTIARGSAVTGTDTPLDATSRDTVRDHLTALTRLRIVEDQPAWGPGLRSARRVNTSPKRHFVDPCLAAAALNVSWEPLADDTLTLGLWFESLAVRDLRVYSQPLNGRVLHYRDQNGLEIDAIIELPDGRWGAFEIKFGPSKRAVDAAAASLLQLRNLTDNNRLAFTCVLTNGATAHQRPDGVYVVPLRMLAP